MIFVKLWYAFTSMNYILSPVIFYWLEQHVNAMVQLELHSFIIWMLLIVPFIISTQKWLYTQADVLRGFSLHGLFWSCVRLLIIGSV